MTIPKDLQITKQELERLHKLQNIFNTTSQSATFEPMLAYVAEHKEIEVETPVRNSSQTYQRIRLTFKPQVYFLLEQYSLANFRDFTNTIRFLINASYENITNNKR